MPSKSGFPHAKVEVGRVYSLNSDPTLMLHGVKYGIQVPHVPFFHILHRPWKRQQWLFTIERPWSKTEIFKNWTRVFTHSVVEGAIHIGSVNGRVKCNVFPVLSFKLFKIIISRAAKPETEKEDVVTNQSKQFQSRNTYLSLLAVLRNSFKVMDFFWMLYWVNSPDCPVTTCWIGAGINRSSMSSYERRGFQLLGGTICRSAESSVTCLVK